MSAVTQVVENSEFARKSLQEGLLNISAYAKIIRAEVKEITKKETVSDSSIVMALSRYGKQLRENPRPMQQLQIQKLVSRSGLVEVIYPKTPEVQERFAMLNLLESFKSASFFVTIVGLSKVSVIVDSSLGEKVRGHFGSTMPQGFREPLACLTMQVAAEEVGRSYEVLEQLASRDIDVVEYNMNSSELMIILNEIDVSRAYGLLHRNFLKKAR